MRDQTPPNGRWLAMFLLVAACRTTLSSPPLPPDMARVDHVVDGDTVVVELGGREQTVRLLGIDTPETKDPRRPVECYGPEAAARTAALLPDGAVVRLERDVEGRDRFGRLLVYAFRDVDGLFVNLDLVASGFAEPLPYPPNTAYADELRRAARDAEAEGRGLWGRCDAG